MKYRKLTGTKGGLGKYHSLWIGEDHLLAVESTGYSEEYSRYYFKEIQALVSRRSARGKILNALFGSLAAISFLVAAGTGFDGAMWMVTVAIPLLLLGVNLFLGPTCRCHIYTQVGSAELPTLCRLRRVKRAQETLRPLIALSQGEIGRDRVTTLAAPPRTAPEPSAAARPHLASPVPATCGYRGGTHLTAFVLLVLHASLVALWRVYANQLLLSLVATSSLFFLGVAIVALMKQKDQLMPQLAKWMTWSGIAALSGGSLGGYFFTFFLNMQRLRHTKPHPFNQFEMYRSITPAGHPAYSAFLLIYAALTAIIALAGLASLSKRERQGAGRRP